MTHKHRTNRKPTAKGADATEAALSLILPKSAFAVLQGYLRFMRVVHGNPGMSMREALALMSSGTGFRELAVAANTFAEASEQVRSA